MFRELGYDFFNEYIIDVGFFIGVFKGILFFVLEKFDNVFYKVMEDFKFQ